MSKYLFVTYGESGWRGVQVRGMRIAEYLKKEEVLFWNLYDSNFIAEKGFAVETKSAGIVDPETISFPSEIEVVVFVDLPSNEFFTYSVFQAALKKNLKIVICEQFYRRNQMQEDVYQKFLRQTDLFLLNGLSIFANQETDRLKIVPPQVEKDFEPKMREDIRRKYDIPASDFLIYGLGYHPEVFNKIEAIARKLHDENIANLHIIVTTGVDGVKKENNLTIIPIKDADHFELLYASDLVLVKFGFLQILESLALHKLTIVLGQGGFTLKNQDKLDSIYKENLRFDLEPNQDTIEYIKKIITDENFRREKQEQLKNLHSGELFGAKKAAAYISNLQSKPALPKQTQPKTLAVLVNEEIVQYEQFLHDHTQIYPLCIVTGMPTEGISNKRIPDTLLEAKMRDLNLKTSDEILPHSFKHIVLFSERRLDGFVDIGAWYDTWVSQIRECFDKADEIYISKTSYALFEGLLTRPELQQKTRFL